MLPTASCVNGGVIQITPKLTRASITINTTVLAGAVLLM